MTFAIRWAYRGDAGVDQRRRAGLFGGGAEGGLGTLEKQLTTKTWGEVDEE